MNGLTAYALSKKHTNDTVDGLGYLKGAPCTIKSTTETDDGVIIVFEWTGTSGATQTSSILVKNGEDGQAQTITTARTVDDDGVVITVVNPDGSIASTATVYDGNSAEPTIIDERLVFNNNSNASVVGEILKI